MSSAKEKIASLSKEIWIKKQELQKLRLEVEAEEVQNYSFSRSDGSSVSL